MKRASGIHGKVWDEKREGGYNYIIMSKQINFLKTIKKNDILIWGILKIEAAI